MIFRMRLVSPEEWRRLAGDQCLIERLALKGRGGIQYDGLPEGNGVYAVSDCYAPPGTVLIIEDGQLAAIERPGRETLGRGRLPVIVVRPDGSWEMTNEERLAQEGR